MNNEDNLRNENGHLSAYYDLYFAIRELQDKYKETIQFSPFNEGEIRKQIREGKPLVEDSRIDLSYIDACFTEISRVYAGFSSLNDDEFLASVDKLIPDLPKIVKELLFLEGDKQIRTLIPDLLPVEILIFLLKNTLVPLMETYSEYVTPYIDFDCWERGCCPVCGHPPGLAELRKTPSGRQRYLFCSLCHTPWPFQRLKCPFCEKTGEKGAGYLSFPDEENYRVDVCNSCNSYIKTVMDNSAELSPVLLDWSSQHIDEAAIRKGYQRAASM